MNINSTLTATRNLLSFFSCSCADLDRIQVNQHGVTATNYHKKITSLVQQTKSEDIDTLFASQEEADIIWPILLKHKLLNTVYSDGEIYSFAWLEPKRCAEVALILDDLYQTLKYAAAILKVEPYTSSNPDEDTINENAFINALTLEPRTDSDPFFHF